MNFTSSGFRIRTLQKCLIFVEKMIGWLHLSSGTSALAVIDLFRLNYLPALYMQSISISLFFLGGVSIGKLNPWCWGLIPSSKPWYYSWCCSWKNVQCWYICKTSTLSSVLFILLYLSPRLHHAWRPDAQVESYKVILLTWSKPDCSSSRWLNYLQHNVLVQVPLKGMTFAHQETCHFAWGGNDESCFSLMTLHLWQLGLHLQSWKTMAVSLHWERRRKFYHVRIMRSVISALIGSKTHTMCYL